MTCFKGQVTEIRMVPCPPPVSTYVCIGPTGKYGTNSIYV